MSAEAWVWAALMSVVAFLIGHKVGVDRACRVFAYVLIEFDLWDAYRAASIRHDRGDE